MAKDRSFDDPLQGLDPVMKSAFSGSDSHPSVEKSSPSLPKTPTSSSYRSTLGNDIDNYTAPPLQTPTLPPSPPSTPTQLPKTATPSFKKPSVSNIQFPELEEETHSKKIEADIFSNIPVSLSVELGRSKISLKEVYELNEGSIVELERLVGEPLDLVVNGQVIAQGEVVAIDNNYGLRVTNIISNAKP